MNEKESAFNERLRTELKRAAERTVVVTLDEYQAIAGSTANKDLDAKTNLAVLTLGLAGESGEVADHVKKHLGHFHELDLVKMKKELGDVLWYVATCAASLGFTLRDVAQANVDKLAERYPNGFNVQDSKNRKPTDV